MSTRKILLNCLRRNEKYHKIARMAPLYCSRMSGPHCNCTDILTVNITGPSFHNIIMSFHGSKNNIASMGVFLHLRHIFARSSNKANFVWFGIAKMVVDTNLAHPISISARLPGTHISGSTAIFVFTSRLKITVLWHIMFSKSQNSTTS